MARSDLDRVLDEAMAPASPAAEPRTDRKVDWKAAAPSPKAPRGKASDLDAVLDAHLEPEPAPSKPAPRSGGVTLSDLVTGERPPAEPGLLSSAWKYIKPVVEPI